MTNEKKNVPELRFPEFSGEWEERKLGDVAKITMGQSPESKYYTEDESETILVQGNADLKKGRVFPRIYTKQVTKMVTKGDILLTVRAPVGKLAIAQMNVCIGRGVCSINSGLFTYYFLEKFYIDGKWFMFSQGSTFESVSGKDIKKLKILLPNNVEKKHIVDFFSKLDRQIQLEELKLEKLEEQKKGYMQKIFSQQLRFKDENGNDFPKWGRMSLDDLGRSYTGLSGKTKKDFGYGESYFITYRNVFKNTIASSDLVEKVNINEFENQNKVEYKDILITTSSETPHEAGMSSIWLYSAKNMYLNSFCFGFRVTTKNIEPIYLARILRSSQLRKRITIIAQGSTRFNVSKNELLKLKVHLPILEEQRRIVDFLDNIDKMIENQSKKIDLLKERKKGFLQKMFV